MQIIRVIIKIKPESWTTFEEIANHELVEVPKQFAGCLRFAYWSSVANPTEVLLYEEWESAETFKAYRESDYFKELGGKLFPLLEGKPDAAYYEGTVVGDG
ncbi:MAG: putative quinol monooxygenase [Nannocystaceae bacterium]